MQRSSREYSKKTKEYFIVLYFVDCADIDRVVKSSAGRRFYEKVWDKIMRNAPGGFRDVFCVRQ